MYSYFSRCHVTTNSVAPTPLLKLHTTHNSSIRSDEGLTLNVSFIIPVRWSIYIINSVDKPKIFVSEHADETGNCPLWNEVKFIDRNPHWYTRGVKEAIYIRLHSNNINKEVMESRFLKRGCPRSGNTTGDW